MNPIELLRDYVEQKYQYAVLELTAPLNKGGIWSLDVDLSDKKLAVEWSEETGFGVSTVDPESYGERTDEAYKSLKEIKRRVTRLLTSGEHTSPPCGIMLSRLRETRKITQQELARRLGVKQASISGIERRDDIQLSTLRRAIEALGGTLEIFGVFVDARYRLDVHSRDQGTRPGRILTEERPIREQASSPPNRISYDEVFQRLSAAGGLEQATERANNICARRTVMVMP